MPSPWVIGEISWSVIASAWVILSNKRIDARRMVDWLETQIRSDPWSGRTPGYKREADAIRRRWWL